MAINGRFRVSLADVFPVGAFVVGDVEKVRDFDKSTPERFAQATDKAGELLWAVPVLDADPVDDERNRVAYSRRARAMHAPVTATTVSGKSVSADGKAAA